MFKKLKISGLILAGALVFSSCDTQQENSAEELQGARAQSNGELQNMNFREEFDAVWEQYLAVKDALVASRPEVVQREASELGEKINLVKRWEAIGDQGDKWNNFGPRFREAVRGVTMSGELKNQREEFVQVSAMMEEGIRMMDGNRTTVYKLHCPTVFNNKGASWLSKSKEADNPYEPETMKSCGSVQEEIPL